VQARFTTREAKALGIRHRVSTYTTLMGESSANRIWNVQLLGRYLDGTILKPGEVFSYNKVMGPRTEERGFREGQMIWNGVLIPSIGGGVCQTATTIFNAAFEAGMPILKRTNHSFYISHYPMGRDATVSWEGSDFVFKNDLDHAILIKAHGDATTFTVTFYGTKQGREVVSSTSTPTSYTQPRVQYAVDPSAPRGSVRMAEGGGPGFYVNVHRKVYERGRLIREDNFPTRYTPQNPTQIYGPGARPPGPYFVLPSGA
jgi:vancomycin resistance protein YoaR